MDNIKINSWNEFDPLRSIMIGTPEKSCNLPQEFPCKIRSFDKCNPSLMDNNEIDTAKSLMDNLMNILKNDYSINVINSDIVNHNKQIETPNWKITNTNENTCPRDTFSILGNTILEAPMSWKCRYFESQAYHYPLLKIWEVNKNVRWLQPPKPLMNDNLYNLNYPIKKSERYICAKNRDYMLSNIEPVFVPLQ